MRSVVLQMGITLDGFVHGAQGYDEWGLPPEEDEVVSWKIPKVVFSKTLTQAEWPETQIASGDLAEDVERLKREAAVSSSPTAAQRSWTRWCASA